MAEGWPAPPEVVCTAVVTDVGVAVALVVGVVVHPARSALQSSKPATARIGIYRRMPGEGGRKYKMFVEITLFSSQ
jgi:hypothetical protein